MMRTVIFYLLILIGISNLFPKEENQTNITFPETSINESGKGEVELIIDSEEDISGLQFTVNYDSRKISLGGPKLNRHNRNFTIVTNEDSSSLKVLIYNLEGNVIDLKNPVLTIPLSSVGKYRGMTKLEVKQFIASSPGGKKMNIKVTSGKIYILPDLPIKFYMAQNFPNPFNAETIIKFDLPEDAYVSLIIYNVLGQRIRSLNDSVIKAGFHSVKWDGRDDKGSPVPSGEYIYAIKGGSETISMKMVLLR